MEDLLTLIKTRQSDRGPFDTHRPISKDDLNRILEAGSWAPTPHNMQNYEVIVVDDEKLLEAIGDIQFTIPRTNMEENNLYMYSTEEELQKKKTGIVNRMPAPPAGQVTNPGEFRAASLKNSLRATSVLLIVMYDPRKRAPGSEGDLLGKIGIGCVMENMWLMAHSLGIGMHIVSAVGYIDDLEKHIKDILGIPEYFKLAYSFRLGYPVSIGGHYLRVRRDTPDYTHYNGYGNQAGHTKA